MENKLEEKIKLLKTPNVFEQNKIYGLLKDVTEEEMNLVLSDPEVTQNILSIDNSDILKNIFRLVPASFQEVMVKKEEIAYLLIRPSKKLNYSYLRNNYNSKSYSLTSKEVRQLQIFLKTIKSPDIFDSLVDNYYFQIIVCLLSENKIGKSFFNNIDIVKLYNNIINNDKLFGKTISLSRKINILTLINKSTPHLLVPEKIKENLNINNLIKAKAIHNNSSIIVDKKTILMLSNYELENVLKFKNVDEELIKNTLKDKITSDFEKTNYNFNELFKNGENWNYNFKHIDYIIFNIIIDCFKENEKIENSFVDFIMSFIIKEEYDENTLSNIKNILLFKIKNKIINYNDYKNLFYGPTDKKTLFYLKFGVTDRNMTYIEHFSLEQLLKLNPKHINTIVKKINIENEDEISNIYAIAIRLYMIFGLERSIRILDGKYGDLNKDFNNSILKTKLDDVEFKKEGNKYLPILNQDLIRFLFETENKNHFINILDDKSNPLNKHFDYLYNNYTKIKNRCHGLITMKKLNIILSDVINSKGISDISYDNYKLKNKKILEEISLGNKTTKNDEKIYAEVIRIYNRMKERTESSIPYVKGVCDNGYTYEMMKFDDPIIFTLGYKGNCCIRVKDIAHKHLLHAALCRNGRVLVIYNEDGEVAAFSPLKRNGEVLIANSIECAHKIKDEKSIEAFSKAIEKIIEVSANEESKEEKIKLVCIGSNAYAKPKGKPFSKLIKAPTIYEKDDEVYGNTDQYHKELDIIYQEPKFDLSKIKSFDPKISYKDPRNKVRVCEFNYNNSDQIEDALTIINYVKYTNAKYNLEYIDEEMQFNFYKYRYCIYNDDWYILIDRNNVVAGEFISNDPRCKAEYDVVMEEVKSQIDLAKKENRGISFKLTK